MIRAIAVVGLALSLAACATHPKLSEASGPYRPLNPGKWTPTADDLRGPRQVLLPANSPYAKPPVASPSPASNPETGQ